MSKSNNSQSGGIGICGLLFVLFVALKLTDNIDWSWWWVTSPLWMPISIFLGGIALFFCGAFLWQVIKPIFK